MNIFSLPLPAAIGALGAGGVIGVIGAGGGDRGVGAAEAVDVPSGSAAPPHAAMITIERTTLKTFRACGLLGNSLLRCIVKSPF